MREAIVLAGGFGTRLRQEVPDVPKPMAPIGGRPFLEILLEALQGKGVERVVLSLGHMADVIARHFGERYQGLELAYAVEQSPLGTGGATRLAMAQCLGDHVFIFNGDTFLDLEVDDVERRWLGHRRPIIVARSVPDTSRYGRLLVRDGELAGFSEKGVTGPGLINAGCYVFNRGQLNEFPLNTPFSLEADFLAKAGPALPMDVFTTHGHFIDIGVAEDYRRAQAELATRQGR